MIRFCIWILERALLPDFASPVIGDLIEQQDRGSLWMLGETLSALWCLHRPPRLGGSLLRSVVSDLRVAARLLRRSPTFTIVSVLTLGLAIGATTAIFSVVEPVLLRPLPYPDAEQLVFVWERDPDGARDNVGFATFRDLITQSRTLERAAAIGDWQPTLSDKDDPERVQGDRVSWSYFRTLGVRPAVGRDFTEEEDSPGHSDVVILSYGLWQRRYGGDRAMIGRPISIDGNPYLLAGVMPASFDNVLTPTAKIWRVLGYRDQPWACRTCHHLRMIARMRRGEALAATQAELDVIMTRLVTAYPKEYASIGTVVGRIQGETTRNVRPALLALCGAVLLVLLIAVANVVSLQLARATRRSEEFAIREALGASRSRLIRQLLTEGLLLAALGGVAGLLVAYTSLPQLIRQLPPTLPRLSAIRIDVGALGVVTAIVVLLALVMGLAPVRGRSGALADTLRAGRRLTGTPNHATRAMLVVGEIALAAMLLVSAGLLGRSLIRLLDVDAGFDATHLLTLEINSSGPKYPNDTTVFDYHDRVREAVRALPGVTGVAVANQLPLGGNVDTYGVTDPANVPANPELVPSGDRYAVSVDYLETMRIPIVNGRGFTASDATAGGSKVGLVSVALAQRMWPNENPIGKRFRVGGADAPSRTVIGVTGNVRHSGLDAKTTMQWYIPERQSLFADNEEILIVRTAGDPAALAAAVRRTVRAIDPTQPIDKMSTMDDVVSASTSQRRLALVLFGAFAVAALLLAIAGIYGVLAGSVSERARELGVRSALGATPRAIISLVVGQGGRLSLLGIALGLGGSVALTRYLRSLLFGVAPDDPATLAGVCVLLAAVTLAASLIPAARAARIDPSTALRSD